MQRAVSHASLSSRCTVCCWRFKTSRSASSWRQRRTGRLCWSSIKPTRCSCSAPCRRRSGTTGRTQEVLKRSSQTYQLIVSFLLIRVSDEQCVMIMSVRKGKRLISRLLPFLTQIQAAAVVMAIARKLPALAKKDKQDQVNISGCVSVKILCSWSPHFV